VKRCPAGAITERGHDKDRCKEYSDSKKPVIKKLYGIDIYGCGLCQTGVPCESRNPMNRSGKDDKHNS
jgi:epoxyqueuosine reductase QueG